MTSVPPKEGPKVKKRLASKSLVIVNTGDGKGKSSSAFGVVVRAVAREWAGRGSPIFEVREMASR